MDRITHISNEPKNTHVCVDLLLQRSVVYAAVVAVAAAARALRNKSPSGLNTSTLP